MQDRFLETDLVVHYREAPALRDRFMSFLFPSLFCPCAGALPTSTRSSMTSPWHGEAGIVTRGGLFDNRDLHEYRKPSPGTSDLLASNNIRNHHLSPPPASPSTRSSGSGTSSLIDKLAVQPPASSLHHRASNDDVESLPERRLREWNTWDMASESGSSVWGVSTTAAGDDVARIEDLRMFR